MGISGLLIIIIGIIASTSFLGMIIGIPMILIGIILVVLAVIKGGISAIWRLGGGGK
ncbi:hypothetical protein HH303_00775 [Rhodospirillaceae bacterium KN72]|uniref:Uncharacterized protein n=1 Tax=Pacificispira spongiicola TaxID=2729598 RepID=A0A7Y0DWR1_9PROT|nr:hypothetical protein [Pacificispira spongiicola]NMM42990.1 hypothetical protein [Pacificispira spongiicola]